jgi:hypothetical protein
MMQYIEEEEEEESKKYGIAFVKFHDFLYGVCFFWSLNKFQ